MTPEILNIVLASALVLLLVTTLSQRFIIKASRKDQERYFTVIKNFTRLIKGCPRCKKTLDANIKRKTSNQIGL